MNNILFISQKEAFERFSSYLRENYSISEPCLNDLFQSIFVRYAQKGEILLAQGQMCDELYFIAQGFCFDYYVWEGKEHVFNFFKEGSWAILFHTFFQHRSSISNIKVSENSTFVVLKYSDYIWLSDKYKEFNYAINQICVNYLILGEFNRAIFRCYSAKERIEYFLKSHEIQYLMQHVPQYRIASWLNMAPETFAKIWGDM